MADLIRLTKELGIPDFSGDGEYLAHYSVDDLTTTLGTRDDDVTNTFTARLLLLLESCWLMEEAVYKRVIADVIEAYWRDYDDHKDNFVPAFLANDVLRLWRTFCVNYEAGTEREPEEKRAKGRLKNYKLKHSRLLTCYSALLYLLAKFHTAETVSREDATEMSGMTPTQRIEWLLGQATFSDAHPALHKVLEQYEAFLVTTNAPEAELIARFQRPEVIREYKKSGFELGNFMFDALRAVGADSRLYRILVVQ